MPTVIQAIRPEVTRNFPIPSFRIRTSVMPAWGEVVVADSPELLFDPPARAKRTLRNFFSSRAGGPLPIERGEAVYLLPPQVMARFAGRPRLYYAVAVYPAADFRNPQVTRLPLGAVPFVTVAGDYSGDIRPMLGVPNARGGFAGSQYGAGNGPALEWGGDVAAAGEMVAVAAPANGIPAAEAPAAGAAPGAAQALAYSDGFDDRFWQQPRPAPPTARALSIVRPVYAPADPGAAAAAMRDFASRYDRWRAAVPDTSYFPHSAICKLVMTFPDDDYVGTGFYIARDRILTCAHNVIDWPSGGEASAISIYPGRNGERRWLANFTVQRADWDYHPSYDGGFDNDLAVIRVRTPPPNNAFFELEDLAATPNSPVIVCGYAAETGDENVQKLDGDTIRDVSPNLERIQYNLQTERGNSGSPVFYVGGYEDEARQQSVSFLRCIGVHVSGYSDTLNQACRLTQPKIGWALSVGGAGAGLALGQGGAHPRLQRSTDRPAARPSAANGNGHGPTARAAGAPARASGRTPAARSLAFEGFGLDAVERLRQEFVANAASSERRNCITITNLGLRRLYDGLLRDSAGSNRRLGSTIQDTMAALHGYGLADTPTVFEFNDAAGRLTRGVMRPEQLASSVEQWMLAEASAAERSAWYLFGLSIMDGYHSVILALSFGGAGDPATHIYWADQIYSGWDDVTGRLDARITSLTQGWWDPLPQDRKARTRVTLWPLLPGTSGATFGVAQSDEDDLGIEGFSEEPEDSVAPFGLARARAADACTDTFCPTNTASTAGTEHFSLEEFRCRDGTEAPERFRGNVQLVMDNLEVLRAELAAPIVINSGYRTCSYNAGLEGAATQSRHLCGQAADIRVQGYTPLEVRDTIERLIADGQMRQGGLGLYNTFVHYDVRGTRQRWDRRR